MHALALILAVVPSVDPAPGDSLLTAMTDAITANTPTIAAVFGALIGLAFLFALGRFIVKKVRGGVK